MCRLLFARAFGVAADIADLYPVYVSAHHRRLDPLNAGSVGVVERLRFRREAHLLQNDRFDGTWGDEFIYAILKAEWEDRQGL
ncbi:hypothetical protein M2324_003655 [Rhodovulum sulfidophilum]|uniref:GNAT family N-acetyltransferase n=1 Tax=Rhodovulum sulfidophilum TaxID=35806 RepID=UPI0018C870B9|nr:GNAT family protein [Rhodovulum sulfidophilum]MCW2305234.1 hypothetical protein [Rhodovulum sulfidophilum]